MCAPLHSAALWTGRGFPGKAVVVGSLMGRFGASQGMEGV